MDKTLLDTDIFSEILKRKNENVIRFAQNYFSKFNRYTISTITIIEVVKGFHKVKREEQIQTFLKEISKAEILTLNLKNSELAGRIYSDLERRGQPVGRADPIVAAIALERNLVLSTGNMKHYNRIKDLGYQLKLHNWKDTEL